MIDMPDRPEDGSEPRPCIRCGQPIPDGDWYIYCSENCRALDVPDKPGIGGVCP